MTEVRFYEVGGCVRDTFLGRKSKDVDYAVTGFADFDAMVAGLDEMGYKVFTTTPDKFTARARVPGSRDVFDFVFARKEGPYTDGRHPDWVAAGTLEDDLARRDFTMNAIARDSDGAIIDPFDGRGDIAAGVIRTVGDPERRFTEDALRILRAIRFAVTLGFTIAPDTGNAIIAHREMLYRLPVERIREEMEKAFSADTLRTLTLLTEYGLTEIVFDRGLRLMPTMKA